MQRQKLYIALAMSVFLLMTTCTAIGRIICVDADANGADDGSSWADAFKYLQDGLSAANSGDEIWVAEGVYKPDANSAHPSGTAERTATFQLVGNVALYGGFDGTEFEREQRDWVSNETVLSGDIGTIGSYADNCYHVVTLQAQQGARIDAFTITGGNTTSGGGGGMVTRNWPADCSGVIANCRFENNKAYMHGGGLNLWGSVDVINCTFSKNISCSYGGGMFMGGHDNYSTIKNCAFQENVSQLEHGGGICILSRSGDITITDCIFVANTAEKGGAILIHADANTIVNACVFKENVARGVGSHLARGGAMKIMYCTPIISNCVFTDNSTDFGGAIANYGVNAHGRSGSEIVNCTFVRNRADWAGGGIANIYHSDPKITNCILWGNEDSVHVGELAQIWGGNPRIDYSCIQGWTGQLGGVGNMGADPCFVDMLNGDYHLLEDSACIDAGSNTALPVDMPDLDGDGNTAERIPWDLDGHPRIVDGDSDGVAVVDVGAYEYFVAVTRVAVDIKPGSCPNPLNVRSQGAIPVAILGSEDFDVNTVDIASVELEGVSAMRSSLEDVETPVEDGNECDCNSLGPDGYMDLTLNFETEEVVEAVGEVNDTDVLIMTLTGVLHDETPVEGTDCVVVRGRYKPFNKGDINKDGIVNMVDFAIFADNWLESSIIEE